MKKLLVLCFCVFFFFGCGKKEDTIVDDSSFIPNKIYDDKEYVYDEIINSYNMNNSTYSLKMVYINLDSEDAKNINMEIRSFINRSYKEYVVQNSTLVRGNIINYDYYVSKHFISLRLNYYYLIQDVNDDIKYNIYVVSLDTGKIMSNESLLKFYDLSIDDIYSKLEETYNGEDYLFTLRNIKDNGYSLYVNSDDQLVMLYYEVTDDESIKKELILN